MGLLQAARGAIGGTLADQWKEFFYCDALDETVLMRRGEKRIGNRSSNKKGNDNVITNGSGIVVADGQCMIIVDQGEIVEICAEPGEFTYNASSEPTIFVGDLEDSVRKTFETAMKRFTFGGDTGKDQRVYYFNTKELIDNKFGTPNPIPFRVVDSNIKMDIDLSVRCSGIYSYKIVDPILFYKNVAGNIEYEYPREKLDLQLKTEFISALAPAFGKMSELELRPSQLSNHNAEIESSMNDVLSDKWGETRGLKIVSVALNPITLTEEDQKRLKDAQSAAVLRDPSMAAATLAGAQAEAMKAAASNENGAMTGFMGMGMAMNAGGGNNTQNLYAMAQQDKEREQQARQSQPVQHVHNAWTCTKCGAQSTGKFCGECGTQKPQEDTWDCSCGSHNKGKFCPNCGNKKPEGEVKCTKCGYKPENQAKKPKFCPECGQKF